MTFFPDFCFIQDLPTRKLIGMGRCENGLYNMEEMDKKVAIMAVKIDSEIWHKRLGHSSKLHHIDVGFWS